MQWPPPLCSGDKVALVAPARYVSREELLPFLSFIHTQGWQAVYDEGLFAREGVLAGEDAHRLSQLQAALDAPDIRAIWCVRGGYGVSRLWHRLSWEGFRRYPKWLIGFSDITPLLWGAAKAGIVALHAPVAIHIPHKVSLESLHLLLYILRSEKVDHTLRWQRKPWYAWRIGTASGMLLGGNLSLLQTLCGTALDPKSWASDYLLFWEEVGEYLYRIDRMSWHLRHAGWYDKANGLLIGGLTALIDSEHDPFGEMPGQIIQHSAPLRSFPIAMGLAVGHSKDNIPIPIGAWGHLRVDEEEARLRFWRSR